MKKWGLFLLLLLCLGLLPACDDAFKASGEVVAVQAGGDGGLKAFVLRTEQGEEIGILLSDETELWPWVDEIDAEDFRAGRYQTGVTVSVVCDPSQGALTTANGMEITAYTARDVSITGFLTQEERALSDGTEIMVWQGSSDTIYKLADGTELLQVWDTVGPANVTVGSKEGFADLSETAQAAVLAYYEAQGLLYDVQAELEKAYAAYLAGGRDGDFDSHMVGQDIVPTAANEQVMYFVTSAILPIDGSRTHELRLGAAFDRQTGESLSNWALFSCPEDEVKRQILDMAGVDDPVLRAEMTAAFRPEYIIFFPENLEVAFPQGALPSQAGRYSLGLPYDEGLSGILNDWAIPQ